MVVSEDRHIRDGLWMISVMVVSERLRERKLTPWMYIQSPPPCIDLCGNGRFRRKGGVERLSMVKNATLETRGLVEATLISFDIPDRHKARRTAIYRFLSGRSDTKVVDGIPKTYRYPGLLDEGGFRLGQSVFLFPAYLASRLIVKLRELRISHRYWHVMMKD